MPEGGAKTEAIDAVLWIGNASHTYRTVEQFAVEAGLRGCCRRLPFLPPWMKPRVTRVFLAHRNGHKNPSHGSLFGYFVLHRLEIVIAPEIPPSDHDGFWPKNPRPYIKWIRKRRSNGFSPDKLKRLLRDKLRREHLPRVARGEGRQKPDWHDDPVLDFLEDVLEELFKEWLKEREYYPKSDSIEGEGHRACSLRGKPGAVYAVDALCAAIHDTYNELLRQKPEKERTRILQELKQANDKKWKSWLSGRRLTWNADDLLNHYVGPFRDAVLKHRPWEAKYKADPRLKNKSTRHGELVLFQRPFPIFERAPQAAFRGILQVDGEALIEQIARHTGGSVALKIKLKESGGQPGKIKTQNQLASLLAEELDLNKACATRFLQRIAGLARQQLSSFQKFKLEGVGTISVHPKRSEREIRFQPSTKISGASRDGNRRRSKPGRQIPKK
ncbi:MAG TPA: hypothetical protein VJA94_03850 [Candidatus Angelobacter sp.]